MPDWLSSEHTRDDISCKVCCYCSQGVRHRGETILRVSDRQGLDRQAATRWLRLASLRQGLFFLGGRLDRTRLSRSPLGQL